MSPEQKRKFNTTFGSLFFGVGLLAWGLTIYFAVTPNDPMPAPTVGESQIDPVSCRTALSTLGYEVTTQGADIVAFEPLSSQPKQQLERATMVSGLCKLPLKEFCMGEGCERPGVSITLAGARDVAKDTSAEKLKKADKSKAAG